MGVFRKIFGSNTDASKDKSDKKDQSKFLESSSLPADEAFTINFNKNGGKFLYCENNDEVQNFLNDIIEENNWNKKRALILNKRLKEKFKNFSQLKKQKTQIFYLRLVNL
jgi:hypothetical protein